MFLLKLETENRPLSPFQVPLAGLARRARVAVRQLLPYRARVHHKRSVYLSGGLLPLR